MLRLQRHLISAVLAVSSATLGRRILSADPGRRFMSTAPASIARCDPDDYLVARCGLTPEQAREASKRLTRLKTPSNPDAVRAFLAGLRIPDAAVSMVVARHPHILCSKVAETLTPRVAELREIGLSPGEISRLVTICPELLLSRLRVSRLEFYFSLMGSCDRVLVALENNAGLLEQSLAGVVKPNLAFLRKAFHVHSMVRAIDLAPRLLTAPQERLDAVVARGEECRRVGRPCKFLLYAALIADQSLLQEEVAAKVELSTSLGLSSCQVGVWASWIPDWFLKRSEKLLQRTADFLSKEVGLEADTIARHLILFQYSMDKRLVPRFNVLKILMEEGLLDDARKRFADPMRISVATFEEIFVHPYEDSIPALAHAYAPFRSDDPPWGRTLPSLAFEDWCHNWGLTKIPVKRNPL